VRQACVVVERQASLASAAPTGVLVDKDMIQALKQLDREVVAAVSELRRSARRAQTAHSGRQAQVKQDLS
jgi:glutamine synthetase type III